MALAYCSCQGGCAYHTDVFRPEYAGPSVNGGVADEKMCCVGKNCRKASNFNGRCPGHATVCKKPRSNIVSEAEESVGVHKVHGNLALLDGDGNLVKASCGRNDRRGKLTHGRTEMIDGVKMCVDWNAGTSGNDAVTTKCGRWMQCCEADEYLNTQLNCVRDVPMCINHKTKVKGYVSVDNFKCNFGDGSVMGCYDDVFCCDEGSNDIQGNGPYSCVHTA